MLGTIGQKRLDLAACVRIADMIDSVFLKPPVHGHVANWLGQHMAERLLEFAQSHRDGLRETRVWNSAKAEGEVKLDSRRSWQIKFQGGLRDEVGAHARALLPDMCGQLGTTRFEPRELEIELVAHCDGAFFREHQDRLGAPRLSRLISAVYYFHRLPKSFSGGALRIYPIAGSKSANEFVEIEPINDTLVFFPSWFPHEVLPVNCPSGRFEDSRFAINCWFHC